MKLRVSLAVIVTVWGVGAWADEGMWRFDQLSLDVLNKAHGVSLRQADLDRLQTAAVRILSASSAGTGTFASTNGLILTNHHVALDCIRTSTLAEQAKASAENLIEDGFTAKSIAEELPCRRFRAQIERSAQDVTATLDGSVKPGMDITEIQRARLATRSDLERACQKERGPNFSCSVVDFNSGARSLLVVYEEFKDVRLVYAPEQKLGYFGGDEMNFRFPRYVSDISILRAYQGAGGSHADFNQKHVPVSPAAYLKVSFDGVKDGDFTFVAGFPGSTNRYRESLSASYNIRKGIPDQIAELEEELALLRKHAAADPKAQVILQSRIFGLANSLKYQQDVLAALKATNVVDERLRREREFMAFLATRPALKADYGDVITDQTAVYANDVEANADLDAALRWLQKSSVVGYASGLYQLALARAQANDRDREPQFQERNWPDVRQSLLDDEPIVTGMEVDVLTAGFARAMALPSAQTIPAVRALLARVNAGRSMPASQRDLAVALIDSSHVGSIDARKALVEAPVSAFEASSDPAVVFARELEPSLRDLRARVRLLNEKILRNRARLARGVQAWRGTTIYPDANFTLRATWGKAAGVTNRDGTTIPFATRFADMFTLAERRGNSGDFALPPKLVTWKKALGEAAFESKYGDMVVNFITTNDITGGNSGSSTLNRSLSIVGLIFDGNEGSMASDWSYNGTTGRALSTDIRFALTIAREVHGAGWIVDELLNPDRRRDAR
jgi:Peptidase S46